MKFHLLALVVLAFTADAVKALKCLQCEYLEGKHLEDKGRRFDESCRNGRIPNRKFVVTCQLVADVCFKVYAQGESDDGDFLKYTIRGCGIRAHFSGYEDVNNTGCQDKNSTELSGLVGYQLHESFEGTVCLCSDDKCNSSSMLKVTQSLVVFGIGFLYYKFIGV